MAKGSERNDRYLLPSKHFYPEKLLPLDVVSANIESTFAANALPLTNTRKKFDLDSPANNPVMQETRSLILQVISN